MDIDAESKIVPLGAGRKVTMNFVVKVKTFGYSNTRNLNDSQLIHLIASLPVNRKLYTTYNQIIEQDETEKKVHTYTRRKTSVSSELTCKYYDISKSGKSAVNLLANITTFQNQVSQQ